MDGSQDSEDLFASQENQTGLSQDFEEIIISDDESAESSDLLNLTERDLVSKQVDYYHKFYEHWKTLENISKKRGKKAALRYIKENKASLPKKPDNPFATKIKKETPNLSSLSGKRLLQQLRYQITDEKLAQREEYSSIPEFSEKKSAEEIQRILTQGQTALNNKTNQSLKSYLKYGRWLRRLFELNRGHFERFVGSHLQYSASWIRSLRRTSLLFEKHKKLQQLSITIKQAMNLTAKITKAFKDDPAAALSWS